MLVGAIGVVSLNLVHILSVCLLFLYSIKVNSECTSFISACFDACWSYKSCLSQFGSYFVCMPFIPAFY